MEVSNEIIEEITQNIIDYKRTLNDDKDLDDVEISHKKLDKKIEITNKLIELSSERADIRKSLGFDLYMLYFGLTEALMDENYERAMIYKDEINRL